MLSNLKFDRLALYRNVLGYEMIIPRKQLTSDVRKDADWADSVGVTTGRSRNWERNGM